MQALVQALMQFDYGATEQARRVFHGRGHCYPGLEAINADWFAPLLLVSVYQPLSDPARGELESAVERLSASVQAVLVQHRYRRGGPMEVLRGPVPDTVYAREGALRFPLTLGGRQNIGFFMDMAPGRSWLQARCAGRRVLNLFAYTCSFSVAAVAAGASRVVNLDMSRAALAQGQASHELNVPRADYPAEVMFLPHDLFRSWRKVIDRGPYDIVVIDPPSRQKGSFVAERDYTRVLRRLPQLLPLGGEVLACLNAPELDADFLQQAMARACPGAVFEQRLAHRPDFPEADTRRNLKLLHYHLPAACEEAQ